MNGLQNESLLKEACLIDGVWREGEKTIAVLNPATGEQIGTVPSFGADETLEAIDAAQIAQKAWAARTALERSNVLERWYDLVMENNEDLGLILTLEQGKPLKEAIGEIAYGASFIKWFAEEARRIEGEIIPGHQPDKRLLVLRQPVGVVAAITPWNFPNAMITRKAAPALAAGCSLVLKPAAETPFSAMALAELALQAGLPKGVLSVVTGASREIGGVLTSDPRVAKLTFTGSTEVGRLLMAQCAPTIKKLSLELGGNAPFIVFEDADLDKAVEGALIAKFRNNGQTCVCANRIYAQAGIYDTFCDKLAEAVSKLKVSNGTGDADLGPLINVSAKDKVEEHIADAKELGGRVLTGGKTSELGGSFFEPTVIADATSDMKVATEETFGPLAVVFRFETEDEVVALANDTEFGLASYFYSKDLSTVWRVSEALEYGMVGINTGLISTAEAPFGGVKQSGMGREGSRHGIEDYVEIKYICMSV
ncbi:MAG: NAD-dependent succinate-semialdehyde dehydrogenase [Donghicola eburneus]|nr:NAD-dependent succinate-semialdehyde dehydrogenase [Donghicola eburneus]MCI5041434.1 NAD-dependent succinate-semialdehyde dehydrogenase [Donghicola eburneus]